MALQAGYRTILIVDIEGYGHPARDDQNRWILRDSLAQALGAALDDAGLSPEHRSDLGDGWMLLLDGNATVSVLHAATGSLHKKLPVPAHVGNPAERLRVRAIVHAGHVRFDRDDHPYGRTVTRAFRMSEAGALKWCLRQTSGSLVVGVSDYLFNEVVRLGHTSLEQSRFEPVSVRVKEEHGTLWVYAPDDPGVAERAGVRISDRDGVVPRVLIAHADGDAGPADELAERLKQAGYQIAHQGSLLTGETGEAGETLVDEAAPVLVTGGPVVVCGTAAAVGTGWVHRLGRVLDGYPTVHRYPVRMEPDAALDLLDWEAEIAEWSVDVDRAVGELVEALAADYVSSAVLTPDRTEEPAEPAEVQEPAEPDPAEAPDTVKVPEPPEAPEADRRTGGSAPTLWDRVASLPASLPQTVSVAALAALFVATALGWLLWAVERGEESRSLASWYDLSDVSVGIASKEFTEQRLLGHMAIEVLRAAGADVADQTSLGSTSRLRDALVSGAIDGYFEYTGTGWIDILDNETRVVGDSEQFEAVRDADAPNGITWFALASANDTYALAAAEAVAAENGIGTISDFAEFARRSPGDATLCTSDEFADRPDGLPGLAEHYGFELGSIQVIRLNPDALYSRIADGDRCRFGVVFNTAGQIGSGQLEVFDDDQSFFPSYNIAMVMRTEVYNAHADAYDKLFGEIADHLDDKTMIELNARIDVDGERPADVAKDFLLREEII